MIARLSAVLAAAALALCAATPALANEPFWTQRPDLQRDGDQLRAGNGGWSSYSGPVTKYVVRFIRDGVVVKGAEAGVPKTSKPDVNIPGTYPDDPNAFVYTLTPADNGHCFVAEVYGGTHSVYYYQWGELAYDLWEWGHFDSFGNPGVTNQICIAGTAPAPTPTPTPTPTPAPQPQPAPPPVPAKPTLKFVDAPLQKGMVGLSYSQQLTVQNGASPTFAVASGALPPGVTLTTTGQLTGIPTKAGVYSFVVHVSDPAALDVNGTFGIQVDAPSLSLGPQTLRGARANQPFEQQLTVVGGYAPYMYSVVAGELPKGMALSADGLLSGTPGVAAGKYTFTVRATDQYNLTTSLELVLTVLPPRMQIDTAKLPAGVKGKPYSAEIVASGASEPYSFTVSAGKLPPGVVLDADGTLQGRPTQAGLFGFTVQAIDANGVTRLHYYGVKITQPAAPKKKTKSARKR